MRIVAIVGSPRPTGNTSYLVDQALQEATAHGLETEKIILSQYRINPCLGHEDCSSFSTCKQNDDAPWILDKFSSAKGIILGTPVYYYNMTAQMKAFIDRNYFLYTHRISIRASCAGLIIVAGSSGIDHTVMAMRHFFNSADISNDRIITVTGYTDRLGGIINQPALTEEARKLGRQMAEILAPAQ
ncbi:flavodoxin family protein [Chloroflexota bacterium]